jgi:hypothetical protein
VSRLRGVQTCINQLIFCKRGSLSASSKPYLDAVTNTTRLNALALAKLQAARGFLLFARLAALDAQLQLVGAHVSEFSRAQDSGSRAQRAAELCELIADAVAHVERLLFFVEGDGC